jgi:hypothetical protein
MTMNSRVFEGREGVISCVFKERGRGWGGGLERMTTNFRVFGGYEREK